MIRTRKELSFYISADRIMNGYSPNMTIKDLLDHIVMGGGDFISLLYA